MADEFKVFRLDTRARNTLRKRLVARVRIPAVDDPFVAVYRKLAKAVREHLCVVFRQEDMQVLAKYHMAKDVCASYVVVARTAEDRVAERNLFYFVDDDVSDDRVLAAWGGTLGDGVLPSCLVPATHTQFISPARGEGALNGGTRVYSQGDISDLKDPTVGVLLAEFLVAYRARYTARAAVIDPIYRVIHEARSLQEVAEIWPAAMDYAVELGAERRLPRADKAAAAAAVSSVDWSGA